MNTEIENCEVTVMCDIIECWSVYSEGTVNGQTRELGMENFDTFAEAMAFAEELAEKYEATIKEDY